MAKRINKITLLSLIDKILDSADLSVVTKEKIVRYYMLPQTAESKAIIEEDKIEVGSVERPNAEEIEIEENPKLKAEYKDTEKLMTGKTEKEEEEDE